MLKLARPRTDVPDIGFNLPPEITGCGVRPLSEVYRDLLMAAVRQLEASIKGLAEMRSVRTTEDATNAADELEHRARGRAGEP